jgi:uncharacterized protein
VLPADLTKPLTREELSRLGEVLLDRFDEGDDDDAIDADAGVLDICELDGFMTAVMCLPVMIMPSQWWPEIWGDFPPNFESAKEFEEVYALTLRQWNGIAACLMEQPEVFEPMFRMHELDGREYLIVDEWCEGYMRGLEMAWARGVSLEADVEELLYPIRAFTEAAGWSGHDLPDSADTEKLQQLIAPNVRALHAYWFERREDPIQSENKPLRHSAPQVGRNDPCPCGSGKKFKKCCLH